MSQLKELAKPFSNKLVQSKPGRAGGDYVSHSTVTERALSVVGAYSIEDVQLIRGHAVEESTKNKTYPAEDNVVVGALITLRCNVDGREVRITEAGDVENPLQKGNDGARAKDAISDAVKRCWMRLGLGLHLWSQEDYFLHAVLERDEKQAAVEAQEAPRDALASPTTPDEVVAPPVASGEAPRKAITSHRTGRVVPDTISAGQLIRLASALRKAGIGRTPEEKAQGRDFVAWLAGADELSDIKELSHEGAERALQRVGGDVVDEETGEVGYEVDKAKLEAEFQRWADHKASQEFDADNPIDDAASWEAFA